ncbi:hypothetical protein B0A81_02605 [Flavobacterium plurextorum]|uniref:Lipoprotein n=1 Tax=Flavobacterium plurextorum TaxID=1114867 RepID=A0ABX4CYM2_9FLAO|nr:hypothetical protein [Flavobacterium plurextorum]OXB10873.1 hypothetical protein B0A81_02605 [Flavobacterium plurextorum]
MIILKRGIIVLVIILFSIVINSCGKCVETNLTKEERAWFSVYEKGQSIVFKSNLGNLDTLLVSEKIETHNNKDCNYYGIGPMQPNIMFITIESKVCHNAPYCNGEIYISKDKIDVSYLPSFSLFGLNQKGELTEDASKFRKINLTTTNILCSQVYHFEDNINASNGGNNYLKSFDWDKKEGLIRYDTNEGEIFELLKIIK